MDKTLETVALVHRLIVALALALLVVGISTPHSSPVYDDATHEIESLEQGIEAVSEQVSETYKVIYDKSELKIATLEWLRRHNLEQQDIGIEVFNPEDLVVPDSTEDPLVTLDTQLKWADRVYRERGSRFFLCQIDRPQLHRALDTILGTSTTPKIERLSIYIHGGTTAANANRPLTCDIQLRYAVQKGTIIGIRTTILDTRTTVINVTQVEPPGPKWVDLSLENTFKEHELGDWEDSRALVVPDIWQLWTDLGGRSPAAAEAFLQGKKDEEAEKSKEKLEIFGASLSRSLTIMMACIVELCLMIYMVAHLSQVRIMARAPEHKTAISESPFYGIMRTRLGRLVTLSTFIIPFTVCLFVLGIVFPSLRTEWPGPHWIAGGTTRWLLITCIGIADSVLVLQTRNTISLLGLGTSLWRANGQFHE
jgi:hypothetical protein